MFNSQGSVFLDASLQSPLEEAKLLSWQLIKFITNISKYSKFPMFIGQVKARDF